ncbi:DUF2064 domain-containing protein [Roseomonas sp. CCTCC AB2023176]|uniref:TIGR04282 family arsenosugar biosynthesis glycosyltransferase n=1 Tax=Roseomonas sp. CCTCC AB2023176 TaxID=3342640 RepID=UPI0035D70607
MSTAAVAIVCKTPIPGRSKTRLLPLVGAESSAALSACFIRDTSLALEMVPESIGRTNYALYAPEGTEHLLRPLLPAGWGMVARDDPDFGQVLLGGMEAFLGPEAGGRHDCAIIVNSDSPTLPPGLVTAAIEALRAPGDRVVYGPATDGGYTLVGLKRPHARLFQGIHWSTPEVLPRSLYRAEEIGLPVTLLPTWYDVDDATTFAVLQGEFQGRTPDFCKPGLTAAPAPYTRSLLASLTLRAMA